MHHSGSYMRQLFLQIYFRAMSNLATEVNYSVLGSIQSKNFSIKTYKGTQVKAGQMERLAFRELSREDERAKVSLNKNDNNKNEASLAVYSNSG